MRTESRGFSNLQYAQTGLQAGRYFWLCSLLICAFRKGLAQRRRERERGFLVTTWARFKSKCVFACDPSPAMDLLDLLTAVPSLLEACINGEHLNFRALREVNKTASLITRGAYLRSYSVNLEGAYGRTGLKAARLLRHTRIGKLGVVLGSSSE